MKIDWNQVYIENKKFSEVPEALLNLLPIRGKVLEVGCGQGELKAKLEARGLEVTGVDLAEAAKPDIVGDFLELDLPRYDTIVANKVIAFNPVEAFLKHVHSHLVVGGLFVLITPVRSSDDVTEHWKSISVDEAFLDEALREVFGHSVMLVDKVQLKAGVENVYVCGRKI